MIPETPDQDPKSLGEIFQDPSLIQASRPDSERARDVQRTYQADEIAGLQEERADIIEVIKEGKASPDAIKRLETIETALQAAHADELQTRDPSNTSGYQEGNDIIP